MSAPIVLVEMNELCPDLLRKWMAAGQLPNFKKFFESSQVFTTSPDVEDARELEPWIQWYSMHTGLPYDKHGVFHLTDGPRAGHKDIWHMLQEAGLGVGNFSSMNAKGFAFEDSFFVADPWSTTERPYPAKLDLYQDFVQSQVQEYTNPDQRFGLSEMIQTGLFLLSHGMSPATVMRIMRQLSGEVLSKKQRSWQRVFILDWLTLDVFRHFVKAKQPSFATVFSNSVAHCQHAYWRCMEPEKFEVQPSAVDLEIYGDAILLAYKNSDAVIGQLFKLERKGYQIVLASALSQQPYLKKEASGGQRFYRMHDVEAFLQMLSLDYEDVQPVMTHQYVVHFSDMEKRDHAKGKLDALHLGERQIFETLENGERGLYIGCKIGEAVDVHGSLEGFAGSNAGVRFEEVFYLINETKSGRHHPDGVLWFRTGQHKVHSEKVSILDVVPTLLEHFGVSDAVRPGHDLDGKSLLPLMG